MRRLLMLTVLIPWPFCAAPALADQIDATSRIVAVTLFSYGAQVTREVAALPPGRHAVRVPDLPQAVLDNPGLVRVVAGAGLRVESTALVADPGLTPPTTAAQAAARAEVARRLAAVQEATAKVALLQAGVAAAEAQQGFLSRLGEGADLQAVTVEQLAAITALVGEGVAAAATGGAEAAVALIAAEAALAEAEAAHAAALAHPDAAAPQGGGVVLALTVVSEAGAAPLQVVYHAEDAGWQPVYDLRLVQMPEASLMLDRGISVTQGTGEDWTDVALTLSTADLFAQIQPGTLYPDLRRIVSAADLERYQVMSDAGAAAMDSEMVVAASPAPVIEMRGDTVTYVYPQPTDVPTGAASLRLSLGEVALPATLQARAVPRMDETAFLVASLVNASAETLLAGEAALYRDGALVGTAALPRLVPGQEADVAFGRIEGLRLTRDMPVRLTGERGVFVGSTEMQEVAVLEVENLTDRAWDVRLIDQVPYAEQEDLEVTYAADLPVTEVDVDGQRGILGWDFTLAPGATQAVRLTTTLEWPEGQVLQ